MAVFLMVSMCSSSFSQVINGRQYNYVGNWYNWQGGKFINNLNLPKSAASTGKDTGAIYYKLSDSSLYIYTGSQWVKVGGSGSTPNLQAVTDVGNTSTNGAVFNFSEGSVTIGNDGGDPYLSLTATGTGSNVTLTSQNIGIYNNTSSANNSLLLSIPSIYSNRSRTLLFPLTPSTGEKYIPLSIRLNSTTYTANDTGSIELGTIGGSVTSATGTGTSLVNGSSQIKRLKAGSNISLSDGGDSVTIAATGGSGDSSWVSTETGTQPNLVGYLINSTLTSLPSGWADQTPDATVTFSGKMIVSGGTTGTTNFISPAGTSTVYANRIRTDYYQYDKLKYALTVIPQDKTASSNGFSIHFECNSLFFNTAMELKFNLTNTSDSGKIILNYDLGTTIASSANLSHSAGDTLDIEVIRDYWTIRARMFNRRTQKHVDVYYISSSHFGTGGRMYLGLLGGEQHFTRFQAYSWNRKSYGWTFLGDSHTTGAAASSEEKSFASLVFRGDETKVANLGNNSVTLAAQYTSHVPSAINLNNPVLVLTGYNTRRDLSTDTATYKVQLDSIVKPLQRAGLRVVVSTLVPNATGTNNNFNTAILNYATANSLQVVRLDTVLRISGANFNIKPNLISYDNVHLSDSGHIVAANEIIKALGSDISELFNDTTTPVKFYNLPTGYETMSHVVVGNDGSVYKQPYRPINAILNAYNNNGLGTLAQRNSEIHVSNPIKTDSALFVHNSNGLFINFNGGTSSAAGSTGSNIQIHNHGVGGTGYPAIRNNITGTQNILINGVTGKTFSAGTISGNNNVLIQSNPQTTTTLSGNDNTFINTTGITNTSGSSNIYIGRSTMNHTTGSNNVILSSNNSEGQTTGNVSNVILIGNMTRAGESVALASGDVVFNPAATPTFWFGRGQYSSSAINMNPSFNASGTNVTGVDWNFNSSRGRGTGESGKILFRHSTPVGSGTTLHSAYTTTLELNRQRILVGSARFQTSTGANVASAGDLTLGNDGNVFTITGTTTINAITTTNWQAGSEIILIFSDNVTVSNNVAGGANTAVLLLAGGANFSATANDVLKLVYNGTSWFEVSRSVN